MLLLWLALYLHLVVDFANKKSNKLFSYSALLSISFICVPSLALFFCSFCLIECNFIIKVLCVVMVFFMVALCNRETIYIFMLWFVLLSSSSSFFSSPNLSRRRLDVCHTSTHGVALVQI